MPTEEELDLHEQHRQKVTEFLERCQKLNIGFENQTIMASRIDALTDALLGVRVVSHEDTDDGVTAGDLIEGTPTRLRFEIDVAERMLKMVDDYGVQAALDVKPDLFVAGKTNVRMNREQRRGQPKRRR